jgi:hypothetical protein
MTRHALAANFGHCQVLVVVDADLAARPNRSQREYRAGLMAVAMATLAQCSGGHALPRVVLRQVVAADAAQARRFAGHAAGKAGQMQLVRKARRRGLAAAGSYGSQRHRQPKQESPEPSVHRRCLGLAGASNW